jgi:hypothetical protein
MIIAIDFDGTCVKHKFPKVGEDIGAALVLRRLTDAGHKLILYTMRSNSREGTAEPDSLGWKHDSAIILETDVLQDAINWFDKNHIPLWGINTNPDQNNWTKSPKAYANLYIDDASLGIPLIKDDAGNIYVDWIEVEILLLEMRLL